MVLSYQAFNMTDSSFFWDEISQRLWVHHTWNGTADMLSIVGDDMLSTKRDRVLIPDQAHLGFPYPNPFNANLAIRYTISRTGTYTLSVMNLLGQEVNMLVNGKIISGDYEIMWNGIDGNGNPISSGVYFISLKGEGLTLSRKAVLIK